MNNLFSLQDKTILVTGASSGIGRQTCIAVSEMGGKVICLGRKENELKCTIELMKRDYHQYYIVDLSDMSSNKSIIDKLPDIDGIVHSAGIIKYLPLKMVNFDNLNKIQQINLNAPFILTQLLLKNKKIKENSSIIFISSIMAMIGVRGGGLYAGTKAGLIGMARVLALELANQKIRVNCIAPGMVKTKMAEQVENTISSEIFDEHAKLYPLGLGTPEDIANSVIFLLSNASRWITGQTFVLDGGYTCL